MNDQRIIPTACWTTLRRRAELLRMLRAFFQTRDFIEVETPILSADCVVDVHLDPFSTTLFTDPRQREVGALAWLQTSPEFAMKRLMAFGGEKIYQVARVFRAGETGARHNPEFTLVEWYCREESYAGGRRFLAELCDALLGCGEPEEISYRDAFEQALRFNPHVASVEEIAAAAQRVRLVPPDSFARAGRDTWLNWLLAEVVEPRLSAERPTVLYDFPASQAALAQTRAADGYQVAERFEFYYRGIELANGYHELRDAEELRHRNRTHNAARVALGKMSLPEESRLLAAMEAGLPACTGCALGFDRLVMLATGAKTIAEVMAFAIDRA